MNVQVDAMHAMRKIAADIPPPLGNNSFIHSVDFRSIEQYESIGRKAVMNISIGVAMIALVIFMLISNAVTALLIIVCAVGSSVQLVGFMFFNGAYVDSVNLTAMVISFGLAVDYSAHVGHGYLTVAEPDSVKRLQSTMAVRACLIFQFLYPATKVILLSCWFLL
jgi:predicted RND superfamily exporter protein